jgi:transcriptional regulator with XRE-family HTH domain
MREHNARSRLALVRRAKGRTQENVSDLSGIPLRTYQRLEAGSVSNPPIRYLVNLAMVLETTLEDICEPDWLEWTEFIEGLKSPSDVKVLRPGMDVLRRPTQP